MPPLPHSGMPPFPHSGMPLPKGTNHRGPIKVIARFENWKISESLIRSNKNFARRDVFEKAGLHEKIYINNSLSNYNKYLWGKAKALLQKNLISNFLCFNGTINIRIKEGVDSIKIRHIDGLINLFLNDELCH